MRAGELFFHLGKSLSYAEKKKAGRPVEGRRAAAGWEGGKEKKGQVIAWLDVFSCLSTSPERGMPEQFTGNPSP